MNTALGKPWQCFLVIPVILAGLAFSVSAAETTKVYDRNWSIKGYIRDDGGATKRIYDRNWNLQGYIKEDRIYDRNWKHKETLRDSNP